MSKEIRIGEAFALHGSIELDLVVKILCPMCGSVEIADPDTKNTFMGNAEDFKKFVKKFGFDLFGVDMNTGVVPNGGNKYILEFGWYEMCDDCEEEEEEEF